MSSTASKITGVLVVCSIVCPGADQRKDKSSPPLAFVRGIHRSPVDSPHNGSVTWKMFPFDGVITLTTEMGMESFYTDVNYRWGMGNYWCPSNNLLNACIQKICSFRHDISTGLVIIGRQINNISRYPLIWPWDRYHNCDIISVEIDMEDSTDRRILAHSNFQVGT